MGDERNNLPKSLPFYRAVNLGEGVLTPGDIPTRTHRYQSDFGSCRSFYVSATRSWMEDKNAILIIWQWHASINDGNQLSSNSFPVQVLSLLLVRIPKLQVQCLSGLSSRTPPRPFWVLKRQYSILAIINSKSIVSVKLEKSYALKTSNDGRTVGRESGEYWCLIL